jgi:hypothetical protein
MKKELAAKKSNRDRAFSFSAEIWKYQGKGGWYFASVPATLTQKIRKSWIVCEEGWGRLPATAQIGSTTWKTAIWFDGKHSTYLLPIKSDVRKKESIQENQEVNIKLYLEKPLDHWGTTAPRKT